MPGPRSLPRGWVPFKEGGYVQGVSTHPRLLTPSGAVGKLVVCILLECFLVIVNSS